MKKNNTTKDKEYEKQLKIFTERFNEEFKKLGISQKEFSLDTGISQSSITQYKNGEMLPNTKYLEIMAKRFGVSGHYLLGKNKSPNYKYEDIIKETGLSPKAFQILKSIKNTDLMKTINFLIEQEEIYLIDGFSPIKTKKEMTQKEYDKALEKAQQAYEQEIDKIEKSSSPILSLIHNYCSTQVTNEDMYIIEGTLKRLSDFNLKFDRHLANGKVTTTEIIDDTYLKEIENQLRNAKKRYLKKEEIKN